MTFTEFFLALWGTDHPPFPWQVRLAERAVAGDWPASVGLPTAAGKTALIDIAVYALAMGAPRAGRRIFFVVDRRIIVDEAADRAMEIAEKLCAADSTSPLGKIADALRAIGDGPEARPLVCATLRGGIARDDSWTQSPRQPLVICSTVDQVGSSLLFRAYETGPNGWPIRAALAAYDSVIVVDEAHTSQPFVQTLARLQKYRDRAEKKIGLPLTVVEMSATPRRGEVFPFSETDEDRAQPLLQRRWEASKKTRLVVEPMKSEEALQPGEKSAREDFTPLTGGLVREARRMRDSHGARVIGVIANRVRTARAVFAELAKDESAQSILMTGRARSWDRDRLWDAWSPYIHLDRKQQFEKPVFVVATQCIEVGANIDFDALVTEVASMDALEQRFGRLNRNGIGVPSVAAIVAQKNQTSSRYEDKVYGKALAASWNWLSERAAKTPKAKKDKDKILDMGVMQLRGALAATEDRQLLVCPRLDAPALMPAHVDLLCQSSPEPAQTPEPAIFLHGPQTEPQDVRLIWRQDMDPGSSKLWLDAATVCPPSAAESISLPVWAVAQWLREKDAPDFPDLEGFPAQEARYSGEGRECFQWKGPDNSRSLRPDEIGPGMMILVPALYGGCDEWGWNPDSHAEVTDIGDAVKLTMGRPMLRFHERLAAQWRYTDLAAALRSVDSLNDSRTLLRNWTGTEEAPWLIQAVSSLAKGRLKLIDDPDLNRDIHVAVTGRAFEAENLWSGDEPLLNVHMAECAKRAERFAADLPAQLKSTVIRAAELHDMGKADRRFQAWLRGGNPIRPHELIARSKKSERNRRAINQARRLAGYPSGARHELMSVAMVTTQDLSGDVDPELLLHLIGSHHGRCRPFAPNVEDPGPVDVVYEGRSASSDHGLASAGSGVSERFWLLTRRYGWYGLAWLEMLVRLADHRQSEAEQKKKDKAEEAADD